MDAMKYRERQTILDLLIGYTNSTFICWFGEFVLGCVNKNLFKAFCHCAMRSLIDYTAMTKERKKFI